MKIKNQVNIAVGLTITVFCVWLAFRKVPFTEITDVISGGNYYWLIPVVVAQLLAILARSQRWVILLDQKISWKHQFGRRGLDTCLQTYFPSGWAKSLESW